ncbi:MAG: Ig-like domain-containing protein [Actinomycetota bacterium]|nr:Ig-like domain-containing protein [Actinomycetota bacterium]
MKKVEKLLNRIAKRLDGAIMAINRTIAVLLALLLLLVAVVGGATYAYFTDTETSTGNIFAAACFEDAFVLSPGKSKATRTSTTPPPPHVVFPIASVDANGKLTLDFGEVPQGNSKDSPDVFRIKSIWNDTLTVQVELSDELAPLFEYIEVDKDISSIAISPGEEIQVATKLDVPKDAAPGDYEGHVIVSALNGFFMKRIPTLVTVVAHSHSPKVLSTAVETETAGTMGLGRTGETTSTPEVMSGEASIPLVSITSPGGGAEVSGSVDIIVLAKDDPVTPRTVMSVAFYVGGKEVGTVERNETASTYTYSWDTTTVEDGDHTLMARAYYKAGTEVSEEVKVIVKNGSVVWGRVLNFDITRGDV